MFFKTLALLTSFATATAAQTTDLTSQARRASPWSTLLAFSVASTSNINDASARENTPLPGLPFLFDLERGAPSLSATELSGGIATSYRLAESATRRTQLRFSLYHRAVLLSDAAERDAPDLENSDFDLTSLTTGIDQFWTFRQGRLVLGAEATLGTVIYGGDPLYDNLNVGGSVRYAFTPGFLGFFRATREAQKGADDRPDAHAWRGSLGLVTTLTQGDVLNTTFNYSEGSSSADYLDYADHEIDLRLALARPMLGAGIELGLTAGRNHHARNPVTGGDRDDDTIEGNVTMIFDTLDYRGFVPRLTLRARHTDSNVSIYGSEEYGLQAGLRSRF
jgi:hypothetical protein